VHARALRAEESEYISAQRETMEPSALATAPAVATTVSGLDGVGGAQALDPLLEKHAEQIAALEAAVPALAAKDKTRFPFYDNVFLLRFVLSFPELEKAKAAVEATLAYRSTPAYAEMFASVAAGTWREHRLMRLVKQYSVGGVMSGESTSAGGPLVIVRGKYGDPAPMLAHLSLEEIKLVFYSYRELQLMLGDARTRETRRLHKSIFLFDMAGMSMSSMMNSQMRSIQKEVSAISTQCYPQMMKKMVMMNAPSWIGIVMALMKRILPTTMTEKVYVCPYAIEDVASDPFISQHLVLAQLPRFVGGSLDDALIPDDISGALYVGMAEGAEGGSTALDVARASKAVVYTLVPASCADVDFAYKLEARGIYVSAAYAPCSATELQAVGESPLDGAAGANAAAENAFSVHDGSVVELLAKMKFDASDGLQKGAWSVPRGGGGSGGVVRVEFSNEHSTFRGKRVSYRFATRAEVPAGATAGDAATKTDAK
jgi:hypothetical protein